MKEGWNKCKTDHSDEQLKNDIALLEEKERSAWIKSFLRGAWFPKEKKLRNIFVKSLNTHSEGELKELSHEIHQYISELS